MEVIVDVFYKHNLNLLKKIAENCKDKDDKLNLDLYKENCETLNVSHFTFNITEEFVNSNKDLLTNFLNTIKKEGEEIPIDFYKNGNILMSVYERILRMMNYELAIKITNRCVEAQGNYLINNWKSFYFNFPEKLFYKNFGDIKNHISYRNIVLCNNLTEALYLAIIHGLTMKKD